MRNDRPLILFRHLKKWGKYLALTGFSLFCLFGTLGTLFGYWIPFIIYYENNRNVGPEFRKFCCSVYFTRGEVEFVSESAQYEKDYIQWSKDQVGQRFYFTRNWGGPSGREPTYATASGNVAKTLMEKSGFYIRSRTSREGQTGTSEDALIAAPWWAWVTTSGIPAFLLFRNTRRERHIQAWIASGRCCRCGYDLKGQIEPRRCPECGTIELIKEAEALRPHL